MARKPRKRQHHTPDDVIRTVAAPYSTTPAVVQTKPILRCPRCLTTKVWSDGRHNGIVYYRCRRCCDPTTGGWTRFQVPVTDPLKPNAEAS